MLIYFTCLKAMESCPKEDISNLKDLLHEENLHLATEASYVLILFALTYTWDTDFSTMPNFSNISIRKEQFLDVLVPI